MVKPSLFYPLPTLSPSLISHLASVDVKQQRRSVQERKGSWYSSGSSSMDSHVSDQLQYLTSSVKHFHHLTDITPVWKCPAWSLQITPRVCNSSRCVGHHVISLLRLFSEGESQLWLLVAECETESTTLLLCAVWSVVSWCSRKGFQTVSDCFMPLKYISYLNKWTAGNSCTWHYDQKKGFLGLL